MQCLENAGGSCYPSAVLETGDRAHPSESFGVDTVPDDLHALALRFIQ